MSIKAKLSIAISSIVAVILILNILIYYAAANAKMQQSAEQSLLHIANQVKVSVEATETAQHQIELALADKLRAAAIAAKAKLDPDIDNVTNEQLVALSQEIGVDDISLWRQTADDIVIEKSSNPDELGLSSKTMDYWYEAFKQLFANHQTSVKQGQRADHFWSGPINYAKSDPTHINKWGYYQDGTTNYMINPFINAQPLIDFDQQNGTETVVRKLMDTYPELLEISGFDPQFFGKDPILKFKKGVLIHNLDVRALIFGQYRLKDQDDVARVQQAVLNNKPVIASAEVSGTPVLKVLYPVNDGPKPYVIGVQFDMAALRDTLYRQLLMLGIISLGLLLFTMAASYWLAGLFMRPVNFILRKVNDMAKGNFGAVIPEGSKDELGQLAADVNNLGRSLIRYTGELESTMEELRSTKGFLESFIEHTSDAIHLADLNGNLIQANRAYERLYGAIIKEAGERALTTIPPDQLSEAQFIYDKVVRGESTTDYETVRINMDGQMIDVSITISPVRSNTGDIVAIACITRDIRMRKEAEERLRRSEKLSVVGQLAASVAHEIRNPLTTLRGFVQLGASRGTIAPSQIEIMLAELDRINMIVSEFLILSKPQKTRYVLADVGRVMEETLQLLESETALCSIAVNVRIEPSGVQAMCEPNQLKQVFLNLIKNSIQAMQGGGLLTVRVTGGPGGAEIEIADNGSGIPAEDLARLGEPFFTRKPDGHGLGLMVCQQIIAQHQGMLQFHSVVGEGTRVSIAIPSRTHSIS